MTVNKSAMCRMCEKCNCISELPHGKILNKYKILEFTFDENSNLCTIGLMLSPSYDKNNTPEMNEHAVILDKKYNTKKDEYQYAYEGYPIENGIGCFDVVAEVGHPITVADIEVYFNKWIDTFVLNGKYKCNTGDKRLQKNDNNVLMYSPQSRASAERFVKDMKRVSKYISMFYSTIFEFDIK